MRYFESSLDYKLKALKALTKTYKEQWKSTETTLEDCVKFFYEDDECEFMIVMLFFNDILVQKPDYADLSPDDIYKENRKALKNLKKQLKALTV